MCHVMGGITTLRLSTVHSLLDYLSVSGINGTQAKGINMLQGHDPRAPCTEG